MKPGFSLEEEKNHWSREAGLKAVVGEWVKELLALERQPESVPECSEVELGWIPGFVTAGPFLRPNVRWTPEQAEQFAGFLTNCAQKARGAGSEPADTYSMAQPSPLRYVPMVTAAGTVQQPSVQTCLKCGNALGCVSCHHENIVKARKLAEDTEAEPRTKPGPVEPTFTLEQVREVLGHMRSGEAEGIEGWRDMKLSDRFNAMLDRRLIAAGLAPEPQEQVTVSKNSVLIDGNVCATFSGKDSLDAARDYARRRSARFVELAQEASNG